MNEKKKLEFSKEEFADILHTHAEIFRDYAMLDRGIEQAKISLVRAEKEAKKLDERLLKLLKKIPN
jgi:hypothetical protein